MKMILTLVILGFSNSAFAQTSCKDFSSVPVPGYALQEFFNPAKGNKKYFFVLPESYCAQPGKRFQMLDPYGVEVGSFTITQKWTGKYNADTLANSKPQDLSLVYRDFLNDKKLDADTPAALMRLTYDPGFLADKSNLHLVQGDFKLNTGYGLNWNFWTEPLQLKYFKTIDYDGVVSLFGSALFVDALSPSQERPKGDWRIPGAVLSPVALRYPCGLNTWSDLMTAGRSSAFDKYKDRLDKPVVVYSSHFEPSCSINTISYLQLLGFKDVRWFELGGREWQYGAGEARNNQMKPEVKQISAAEVLKMKTMPNVAIIDMRWEGRYKEGHIAGALSNPFILVPVEKFIKETKAVTKVPGFINPNNTSVGYMRERLDRLLRKEVDTLIFYTESFQPTDFVGVSKQMSRHFEKPEKMQIYFYQGGMADWSGRSQWQPETYKIETKSIDR